MQQTITFDSQYKDKIKSTSSKYVWRIQQPLVISKKIEIQDFRFQNTQFQFSPKIKTSNFSITGTNSVDFQFIGRFETAQDVVEKFNEQFNGSLIMKYDKSLFQFSIEASVPLNFSINNRDGHKFLEMFGFNPTETAVQKSIHKTTDFPKIWQNSALYFSLDKLDAQNLNTSDNQPPHTFCVPNQQSSIIIKDHSNFQPIEVEQQNYIKPGYFSIQIRNRDGSPYQQEFDSDQDASSLLLILRIT